MNGRMSPESIIEGIRTQGPLVHAITNYVAMDLSANALLAIGASPAMIHAEEEAAEFAPLASALTINIGTLSGPWVRAMEAAADAARARGRPVVLDPVGAGATGYRRRVALGLLGKSDLVRGNASEIRALVEEGAAGKGVDATDDAQSALSLAQTMAKSRGLVVAMTGEVDIVTDGARGARVRGGHPWLTRVTATGCALSAVVAAACTVGPAYEASLAALALFKDSGERAASRSQGPGSFRVAFLDALAESPSELSGRIETI
ncbi:MAG: hydroxyethylthiazole kinase [Myxococcota bacterium]